ncbi:N-terminal phage integrase SAM-like domain-containing protein [Adlercreutzia sp. ZJ304]|uniref:N-terminal phage integrase SAM-like domain-containing protein n=1 Tax=Adlercreutzia sp. ZJ304 TaxID=2709791 RepID=UPI0013ECE924|nr:N-terminal phage integrase SAM-like domain-containing protein [Adlercreutzia sp. ZJ304]
MTFKKRMSRAASMEFSLACDVYLADNATRVRDTTLEQKRYYIDKILKPYFDGMLIGEIDAKTVIDWKNHLLESRTRHGKPYTATYLNTLCSQLSAITNHLVRLYGLEKNPVQIAGKIGSKEKRDYDQASASSRDDSRLKGGRPQTHPHP